MKILLITIGTRGDAEPFVALGQKLQSMGHEVGIALLAQYTFLAEQAGLNFFSLGDEFLKLIDSEEGQAVMSSGGMKLKNIRILYKIWKESIPINKALIDRQRLIVDKFKPEHIYFHPKASYVIPYYIVSGVKATIFSPVPAIIHPFKGLAAVGINKNLGEFGNKLTYSLTNYANAKALMLAVNQCFKGQIKFSQVLNALKSIDIIYNVEPGIVGQQDQLPSHAKMVGFMEVDKKSRYVPSSDLLNFMNSHHKFMLVTFGSMSNSYPEKNTKVILDALALNNIPAIINIASNGLVEPEEYDRNLFFFIRTIPYDYILPKTYALVHHGGAGTTQSAILYGCPTMAIPHTVDQPMWNRIIAQNGFGPLGLPINKLKISTLAEKFLDIYQNEKYLQQVKKVHRLEDHSTIQTLP